ncbi:MAG: D-tyrosyl-tRNA(Tyr) deacylase [Methanomicrobiaceae archaeon]|nr:D-tyrosyl-tRNA(Tyr) deacylase [Methanomicrobiaceae archaeon]
MQIALINSALDPAGTAIRGRLLDLLDNPGAEPVVYNENRFVFLETEGRLIYEEGLDDRITADCFIFISRHTSVQAVPALTVHVTGNITGADYGGAPRSLARAAPARMHAILGNLRRAAPEGYRVSYEVTHHGPSDVTTPSLFAEIGSTEKEWRDPAAADAVARSILAARPAGAIPMIGFGGNHYAARQTSIALSSRAAFGHIAHSRQVGEIDRGMVRLMRERTGAVAAYIDRKAVPAAVVRRLESLCSEEGLVCLSESEILGIGSLDWDAYSALRACAGKTMPGARLHTNALSGTGTPVIGEIDPVLLEEALKVDHKRFLGMLSGIPAGHLISEGGVVLPRFLTFREHRSRIIHDLITFCVKIIISSENTAVEGDRLIIRRVRFDPRKARDAGVPAGPLFGRLAEGVSVEIGGATVTSEMVSTCSETIIRVPGLERYT